MHKPPFVCTQNPPPFISFYSQKTVFQGTNRKYSYGVEMVESNPGDNPHRKKNGWVRDDFHKLLEEEWGEGKYIAIPRFDGIYDGLNLYKKRSKIKC